MGELEGAVWRLSAVIGGLQASEMSPPTGGHRLASAETGTSVESPVWETIEIIFASSEDAELRGSLDARDTLRMLRRIVRAVEENDLSFLLGMGERSSNKGLAACAPGSGEPNAKHWLRSESIRAIDRIVTQRQREEQELLGIRRAIYNFAYGLSHEINNPLANISARAQMMLTKARSEEDQKSLSTIIDQSRRAHEMLAEAMLVIQPPILHPKQFSLLKLVESVSDRFRLRSESKNVSFHVESNSSHDPLWIEADIDSIREILEIGFRNALEAVRSGDTIKLIVENDSTTPASIRLAIMDNGVGLSTAKRNQAFDLFYSGREAGRGLGIGLSKLRRLVESLQGRVWLDGAEEMGVVLEMRFPKKVESNLECTSRIGIPSRVE